MGVAPVFRGDPGYRERLDADLDGVACEPYIGLR
ncbi:MAG: excalibur calcium-binding domain-containing protein [Polymorphobacter sp.]